MDTHMDIYVSISNYFKDKSGHEKEIKIKKTNVFDFLNPKSYLQTSIYIATLSFFIF